MHRGGDVVSCAGTPVLAAAGSGDLLSGIAGTLLAQIGDAHVAGACAAWAHGRAAEIAGRGHVRGVTLADVERALREVWNEPLPVLAPPVLADLPRDRRPMAESIELGPGREFDIIRELLARWGPRATRHRRRCRADSRSRWRAARREHGQLGGAHPFRARMAHAARDRISRDDGARSAISPRWPHRRSACCWRSDYPEVVARCRRGARRRRGRCDRCGGNARAWRRHHRCERSHDRRHGARKHERAASSQRRAHRATRCTSRASLGGPGAALAAWQRGDAPSAAAARALRASRGAHRRGDLARARRRARGDRHLGRTARRTRAHGRRERRAHPDRSRPAASARRRDGAQSRR